MEIRVYPYISKGKQSLVLPSEEISAVLSKKYSGF